MAVLLKRARVEVDCDTAENSHDDTELEKCTASLVKLGVFFFTLLGKFDRTVIKVSKHKHLTSTSIYAQVTLGLSYDIVSPILVQLCCPCFVTLFRHLANEADSE